VTFLFLTGACSNLSSNGLILVYYRRREYLSSDELFCLGAKNGTPVVIMLPVEYLSLFFFRLEKNVVENFGLELCWNKLKPDLVNLALWL